MNSKGIFGGPDESCAGCGKPCALTDPDIALGGRPDPCLGVIPGVIHACCGHGGVCKPYVVLANAEPGTPVSSVENLYLSGEAALDFFRLAGCGPQEAGRA